MPSSGLCPVQEERVESARSSSGSGCTVATVVATTVATAVGMVVGTTERETADRENPEKYNQTVKSRASEHLLIQHVVSVDAAAPNTPAAFAYQSKNSK